MTLNEYQEKYEPVWSLIVGHANGTWTSGMMLGGWSSAAVRGFLNEGARVFLPKDDGTRGDEIVAEVRA